MEFASATLVPSACVSAQQVCSRAREDRVVLPIIEMSLGNCGEDGGLVRIPSSKRDRPQLASVAGRRDVAEILRGVSPSK